MMSAIDTNAVYDVLVEECGAHDSPDERAALAIHWPDCREYRFQGKLGFGGKVWWNPSRSRPAVYVTCYREDQSDERNAMIERANARLSPLSPKAEDLTNERVRVR